MSNVFSHVGTLSYLLNIERMVSAVFSRSQFKFLKALLILLYCSHVSAICYWPDGTLTAEDVACQDNSAESACCSPGFVCLSSGLCMVSSDVIRIPGDTIYRRSSCTDSTWRSSSCASYCLNEDEGDIIDGSNGITKCDGSNLHYYCQDSTPANCSTLDHIIQVGPGKQAPNLVQRWNIDILSRSQS